MACIARLAQMADDVVGMEVDDPDFKYDRVNYRMNFDFNLTKSTQLSISSSGYIGSQSNGGKSENDDGPNAVNNIYTLPPYVSPYVYPAEFVAKYPDPNNPVIGDRVAGNLLSTASDMGWFSHNYKGTSRTVRDRLGIDATLVQQLDFITKGLSLKVFYSYNNYSTWTGGNYVYTGEKYFFTLLGRFFASSSPSQIVFSKKEPFLRKPRVTSYMCR